MNLLTKVSAFVISGIIASCSAMSVFADDYDYETEENFDVEAEAETEDDAPAINDKYVTDASKFTTDSGAPTLSFDMKGWEDLIDTVDTSSVKFSLSIDNKSSYQGQSLLVTANNSIETDCSDINLNWECTDKNGDPIFEAEAQDGKDYVNMGIMLSADKFGLECFNGSTLTFKYRLGQDTKNHLMANTIIAAPVDENGKFIEKAKVAAYTYNTAEANNVTSYANGVLSVADLSDTNTVPAKKILILLPVSAKADNLEVVEIDNLTITLPSGATCANVDGYSKIAPTDDGEVELQIKQDVSSVEFKEDKVPLSNKLRSVFGVVLLVVVGVGAAVGITIAVIRAKKRFY